MARDHNRDPRFRSLSPVVSSSSAFPAPAWKTPFNCAAVHRLVTPRALAPKPPLCASRIASPWAPPRSAAEVVAHALAGDCTASGTALETFCALLGSATGDIALMLGALGGVYIGGGMVPRFTEFIERSSFRTRFEGKGRLSAYLAAIPTCVITHPYPALLGLARLGRKTSPRARLT